MAEKQSKTPARSGRNVPVAHEEGWQPFVGLRREIDRLFEDFLPAGWREPSRPTIFDFDFGRPGSAAFQVAPAMDVVEKEKAFEITAELPGMDEKDIEISVSNGAIVIKGEKSEEKEEKEKEYFMSERRYGSFRRSFQLPETVDADRIEAAFAKGVLTVKLPKSVEAQKSEKKIEVKAA